QWVLKPENSLVWHREIIDFINKHSSNKHNGVDGGRSDVVPELDSLKI
ncbi:hypothetical protein IMZ48_33450, partial [Candidatus Bathyarchaeota archaeon]|nr:hypothetical protein [Candidatus Bathyarchaeota archaeon]